MGLLCEYFTAASDAEAKETIRWAGGPGTPRGGVAAHPTLSLPGLEPTMWMGKLDEILTGRSFEVILDDPSGAVLAEENGGEQLVVAVTASLQAALLALEDKRIDEVAARWAEPDEDSGTGGDPSDVARALRSLLTLLRAGHQRGERLFCWVCV